MRLFRVCAGSAFAILLCAAGCSRLESRNETNAAVAAISRYGCGNCHTIRGVPGANGVMGPPLDGVGSRPYVAGVVANTPENLMRWIVNPKAVNPGATMPELHVSPEDAAAISNYLLALK